MRALRAMVVVVAVLAGCGSPTQEKPVVLSQPATPLAVAAWMTGVVNPNQGDDVGDALERGTFVFPPEGDRADARWARSVPGENGEVGAAGNGRLLYAAVEVEPEEGTRVLLRADNAYEVWAGADRQPADIYGSAKIRVPVAAGPEKKVVVVQGAGGRGDVRAMLYTTPDEVYLNLEDMTFPDLVAGASDEQHLGVHMLTFGGGEIAGLTAEVEESAQLRASSISYTSLAGGAVTQIAFRLVPKKPWPEAGTKIPIVLRVGAPGLDNVYRRELTLTTVAAGSTYRRTFRSAIDGSTQYYGVVPPAGFDPSVSYGLLLTLHGAGVDSIGLAQAYSQKDWLYIAAPTNRRPFGFDWEEWGRLDGIEVLDQASATFGIDPTRVYVAGHSMGGHGTWQLGTLFPGRFATLGPSAGWGSFYSYTGRKRPTGAFARSQASSDIFVYLGNLARRGVYVLQGEKDDNVPLREAQALVDAVKKHTSDVVFYVEPGGGHWWDGDRSPGSDCVDWPPLFDFMKAHTRDPFELEFQFTTASPRVSAAHSFVTVRSQLSADEDSVVSSKLAGDTVELATSNVRSMVLDGKALRDKGVASVRLDGQTQPVEEGPMAIGPQGGKRPLVEGPLNEVFRRPFCFVYPDKGPAAYRQYASFLVSNWAVIGNGQGCALPQSKLTAEIRKAMNLVYLGLRPAALDALGWPISWDAGGVTFDETRYDGGALVMAFPEGDRLSALFVAPAGQEFLLFRLGIFHSGFAVPDYMIWSADAVQAAGFFTSDWSFK